MMSLSGITTYTKAAKSRNGTNPSTSTFKSRNKVDISFSTSGKSKECYESDALLRHPTTTASSIKSNHTAVEIWQWTLTHDAIAPCFIKDIFRLQECDSKDAEFYWLGRVPCRTVRVLGIVVGIQVYEKRTIYSVDDGTGVIECAHRHPVQAPSIPTKHIPGKREARSTASAILDKYRRPQNSESAKVPPRQENSPPKPIAEIGGSVRVVGRVIKKFETRSIYADEIDRCPPNDEPAHWLEVCDLHRTSYFPLDGRPFIIPPPTTKSIPTSTGYVSSRENSIAASPIRNTCVNEPQSPSTSTTSSANTSPSSVASSIHGPQSPPRLRHPSRLHTRDLTANTFRIYLKHYMDNAPPESEDGSSSENSGTEDEEIGFSLRNSPGTPTKLKLSSPQRLTQRRPVISGTIGRCRTKDEEEEMTPRPSKKLKATSSTSGLGRTPRAAFTSDSSKHMSPVHDVSSCIPSIRGFQMSYLRRVPELALLAKRVVEAEAKRRAREDRKKMLATVEQEKTSQGRKGKAKLPESRSCYRATSSSSSRMPGSLSTGMKEGEVVGPKMKRLFRFAIRQLHEEGSIIIWDGAARRISLLRRRHLRLPGLLEFSSSPSSARMDVGDDRLWKSGSSSMSTNGSSLVSTISMGTGEIGEYEGELSDPSPDEEAYISLTPPYLLGVVEKTIRDIMSHPPPRASKSSSSSMRRVGPHQALAAPPPGPTVTEILTHIRNNDGRWDRVGEWAVKEALEFGKSGGRVWCVGGGRWELCA